MRDCRHILKYCAVDPNKVHYAPTRHYGGDAGFDLTCTEQTLILPGDFGRVSTNIRVALPQRTWGFLVGRSSTFLKRNLIVNPGIIDNGWRGELMAVVYNPTKEAAVISEGDRIIQLIIFNLLDVGTVQVESGDFPDGERGENGFGSTGGHV